MARAVSQEYVWEEGINDKMWYGASDLVGDKVDVRGMVHYCFACFGGGTPKFDDYGNPDKVQVVEIAEQPFTSALPSAMLARGALAFIGHIERAWGYSFIGASSPVSVRGLLHARRSSAP